MSQKGENVALLRQGAAIWNARRSGGADLSWANLIRVDLRWANLYEAYFVEADLRGADLRRAVLISSRLNGANLTGAKLWASTRYRWSIKGVICTVDPRKPVQCFGKEAAAKNRVLVEGQEVRLEKDISDTDRYGRLLRYVYVGDTLINELLVSEGYAHASSYPPDVKYQEKLRVAEEEARAEERGLWGNCAASTPAPSSSSTAGAAGACQYSCSSPDRDCSDFPDPTAAQDFFGCCGFTATDDPMKLDSLGIGDGVACDQPQRGHLLRRPPRSRNPLRSFCLKRKNHPTNGHRRRPPPLIAISRSLVAAFRAVGKPAII